MTAHCCSAPACWEAQGWCLLALVLLCAAMLIPAVVCATMCEYKGSAACPRRRQAYSCWSTASGARVNNYGSRIDLILAAEPPVELAARPAAGEAACGSPGAARGRTRAGLQIAGFGKCAACNGYGCLVHTLLHCVEMYCCA